MQKAASDQGLHCLLIGISIKNKIKMKKSTPATHKNGNGLNPIDMDGIVHLANKC